MTALETQKHIISASRRTDIPAFYAPWFMNRVAAGFCQVANPYNPKQVARVSLEPADVRAIVFWTRNPRPLMPFLDELDRRGYPYYFLYTLIGYPRPIDPYSPAVESAIETFQALSSRVGRDRVIWRYDPLILSNLTPVDWHRQRVKFLVGHLKDFTRKIIFSFVEPYRKTCSRLAKEAGPDLVLSPDVFKPEAYAPIVSCLAQECRSAGLALQSCAEEVGWPEWGIRNGSCVDPELIGRLTAEGCPAKKDPSQRTLCHCAVSKDIGAPNTCLFGCRYCYATLSAALAEKNHRRHDPGALSLLGGAVAAPPSRCN